MNPYPSAPGDAKLLASVLAYLAKKNVSLGAPPYLPPGTSQAVVAISAAAVGILASARDSSILDQLNLTPVLSRWAYHADGLTPGEAKYPQFVAATLLWADAMKNGV